MNPALNYTFENIHKDQTGRIISIDLYFNENKFSLCNVMSQMTNVNNKLFYII